jgi:aldehyde dehydrogenase
MSTKEQLISAIVEEVIEKLKPHLPAGGGAAAAPASARYAQPEGRGDDGVFPTVDSAVKAAAAAQLRVAAMSLEQRGEIIAIIRRLCLENAERWGRLELEETKIGRLDHKIEKLKVIRDVPGIEMMGAQVRTDASGVCLIENAPWGVIAMALPATHSVPTMAGNIINVVAAGNTAVFTPHPAARKINTQALQAFHREIEKKTGVANVITTLENPSIEAGAELFAHPGIALICVTGGPAVVKAAMKAGKRVIAAGPGNPPVVVDGDADLDHAARCIIEGAAFDNNLLCIGEKEVFVIERVAREFLAAMRRAGAFELESRQMDMLARVVFSIDERGRHHLKREFVGQDTQVLGEAIGIAVPPKTDLLFGETEENHPFVQVEQMMPCVPVVRVPDFERAVEAAVRAEHGYRHTAIIHSANLEHVTRMARAMNTTLFVHNAASTASLGRGGPGYLSYSIATPTGEGVTTPLTFTRQRQLTVAGALKFT